jgi:hypothetical protein
VKQEWLPSLPAADRAVAAAALGRRLEEQEGAGGDVERIRRSLEDYLGSHTEIIIR